MTAPPSSPPEPTVVTPWGPVVGERRGGSCAFRGIPYASADRFGPPGPPPAWTEPLDATRPRAQSPQVPGALERLLGNTGIATDEACHHLDVFTPANDDGRRPVLVWIHGGAFVTGGGAMPWYHGAALAEHDDVVVVTINYRLGAFGFTGDTNCGLADQVAALEWVRDTIEAFGGDPGNVTVFGESAGGASVVALLAVPAARPLFARAWAMSPSLTQLRSARRAERARADLLAAAGVDDLAHLARLDTDRLLVAQSALLGAAPDAITAFAPTVDGTLVPEPIVAAAAADPRPLVVGTNRDEMHLFTAFDPGNAALDEPALLTQFTRCFGDEATAAVARYRERRPGSSPGQLVSAMQSDEAFRVPARALASARDAATWMYWFTWETPAFGGLLGACHGLDIPFAFRNLDRPGVEMFTSSGDDRRLVADEFAGALIRFARSGDPGWPGYDTSTRATCRISTTSHVDDDPEAELRELWDEHSIAPFTVDRRAA